MGGSYGRPAAGSLTGRVWDIADTISRTEGRPATKAEVLHVYLAEGGNAATCRTQFSRWKQVTLLPSAMVSRPASMIAASAEVLGQASRSSDEEAGIGMSPAGEAKDFVRPAWDVLLKNGFTYHADWTLDPEGRLQTDRKASDDEGVYVFVVGEEVVYVGVSDRLSRRMGNYRIGHKAQSTSHRINALLLKEAQEGKVVRVLTAAPGAMDWNGFAIRIAYGLERILIEMFRPRWNLRR